MGSTRWWKTTGGLLSGRARSTVLNALLVTVLTLFAADALAVSSDGSFWTLQLIDPFCDDGLRLLAWCACRVAPRAGRRPTCPADGGSAKRG